MKVLYVKREGDIHSIRELEVSTKLQLNNLKDYETGSLLYSLSLATSWILANIDNYLRIW